MSLLHKTLGLIAPACADSFAAAQDALNAKTKPRGSLGRLEELACRMAAMRRTLAAPSGHKTIVVMCADHGVADEGVSAFPQAVTVQMLQNFADGGAAICVLARQARARLVAVDMGTVVAPPPHKAIVSARVGPGTRNFARQPAMTRAQLLQAIDTGITMALRLIGEGTDMLGLGEMGIANTTSASALSCVLLGVAPTYVTGHGTGIDAAAYGRKISVIERAVQTLCPDPKDPLDVLQKLGGFEIAGLVGLTLGAAAARVPVLVDGLIASAAALVALRLAPHTRDYLIAAHTSVEPGHVVVLEALGHAPLLDLGMRLGEGTGVALAMQLCDAAQAILCDMATFDAAGVSGRLAPAAALAPATHSARSRA